MGRPRRFDSAASLCLLDTSGIYNYLGGSWPISLARQPANGYRQALAADPFGTKTRLPTATEPSRTRRNDVARPIARSLASAHCLGHWLIVSSIQGSRWSCLQTTKSWSAMRLSLVRRVPRMLCHLERICLTRDPRSYGNNTFGLGFFNLKTRSVRRKNILVNRFIG
jgi:hypothetical protein